MKEMIKKCAEIPNRFYSLDVLRGGAALSVVLWHWQHFFLPLNQQGVEFVIDRQPAFSFLKLFYVHGWLAVELFFCLSGFIFFWLYAKRIAEKDLSLGSFAILRLSRLYPLHFATLVVVAAMQPIYMAITNTSFVYQYNDTWHFILNLFFISSWGLEKGGAFNAPVWSVSIEIALYAIFFAYCRKLHLNSLYLIFMIVAGYSMHSINGQIAIGVECFFIGGVVFLIYKKIISSGDTFRINLWGPFVAAIVWLGTIWVVYVDNFIGWLPLILQKLFGFWPVVVLFPVTILTLALLETKRGSLGKRFSVVGDITYSSYLLHFPLQLLIAIFVAQYSMSSLLFYNPWFMAMFFFTLIAAAFYCHRYFEMPMQGFFRGRLHKIYKKQTDADNTTIA